MTSPEAGDAFISHSRMADLRDEGVATPLSRYIDDHTRYDGQWWIADRDGWHLVTDAALHEMLDVQSKWARGNIYVGRPQ